MERNAECSALGDGTADEPTRSNICNYLSSLSQKSTLREAIPAVRVHFSDPLRCALVETGRRMTIFGHNHKAHAQLPVIRWGLVLTT